MIYLATFFVSIFCTYIAQRQVSQRLVFLLFSSIAILLPAVLAGFRDIGVGTDTVTYSLRTFEAVKAHNYTFLGFLNDFSNEEYEGIEFSYLLINYVVSVFFNDIGWLHFFISLIIIVLFYLAAYDNRKRASMWLVMTLFYFLFYNATLNIMRQSISVAMTLYAFKHIEDRRWLRSLIWGALIFSAHSSGIFFLFLLGIHRISYLKNTRVSMQLQILLALTTSLFFIYFDRVLSLLMLVSDKFSKYSLLYSNEETSVTKGILILYVCFLLTMLIVKKFGRREEVRNLSFYIYCRFLGIVFFLTSLVSITASRISWYLNVLDCIFIPRVLFEMSLKRKAYAKMLTFIVITLTVIVWYWSYVINNGHETYPYRSKILGIY